MNVGTPANTSPSVLRLSLSGRTWELEIDETKPSLGNPGKVCGGRHRRTSTTQQRIRANEAKLGEIEKSLRIRSIACIAMSLTIEWVCPAWRRDLRSITELEQTSQDRHNGSRSAVNRWKNARTNPSPPPRAPGKRANEPIAVIVIGYCEHGCKSAVGRNCANEPIAVIAIGGRVHPFDLWSAGKRANEPIAVIANSKVVRSCVHLRESEPCMGWGRPPVAWESGLLPRFCNWHRVEGRSWGSRAGRCVFDPTGGSD
jgi:hypothetical protein